MIVKITLVPEAFETAGAIDQLALTLANSIREAVLKGSKRGMKNDARGRTILVYTVEDTVFELIDKRTENR